MNEPEVESPQPPVETNRRYLVSDLHAHLWDEQLSDISLQGTNGKTVRAVRSILAMRSPFFKSLLFGKFSESSKKVVELGFSSLVLQAVVEYCYTDEIQTTFADLTFEETARSLVGLVAAGHYVQLEGLEHSAYRLTCLMMDEYPSLGCAVLDESLTMSVSGGAPSNSVEELARVAQGIIRLRMESALLPTAPDDTICGVQSLGAIAMDRVMRDGPLWQGDSQSEWNRFCCLVKWARASADDEERQEFARQLAESINLTLMTPTQLSTAIAESGLFSIEALCQAYQTQALEAERQGFLPISTKNQKKNKQDSSTVSRRGKVVIQGAGLSAVNGTYQFCLGDTVVSQMLDIRAMRYHKLGHLNGQAGEFCLQMCYSMKERARMWYLIFVPRSDDDKPQNHQNQQVVELYMAPVLGELDPPPMQKWVPVVESHENLILRRPRKSVSKQYGFGQEPEATAGNPPPICIWLPEPQTNPKTE